MQKIFIPPLIQFYFSAVGYGGVPIPRRTFFLKSVELWASVYEI